MGAHFSPSKKRKKKFKQFCMHVFEGKYRIHRKRRAAAASGCQGNDSGPTGNGNAGTRHPGLPGVTQLSRHPRITFVILITSGRESTLGTSPLATTTPSFPQSGPGRGGGGRGTLFAPGRQKPSQQRPLPPASANTAERSLASLGAGTSASVRDVTSADVTSGSATFHPRELSVDWLSPRPGLPLRAYG